MDIGGGSVEFIIADQHKMHYAASFKIGVAVLRNLFHKNEPILASEILDLKKYLKNKLHPLFDQMEKHNPGVLIGASGTFDVLESVLPKKELSPSCNLLNTDMLHTFIQKVVSKNLAERKLLKEVPNSRIDLIVVALFLIEFIWDSHKFDQLAVTSYTMKEGMLQEMMHDLL